MRVIGKLALPALLLSGTVATCAVLAPAVHAKERVLQIVIGVAEPSGCLVTVNGQSFAPGQHEALITTLKQLRTDWASVSIIGGVETPYKCIGGVIYAAQMAGFQKVAFISEPPPVTQK